VGEDLQFWFQIWLLAFPNTSLELGLLPGPGGPCVRM